MSEDRMEGAAKKGIGQLQDAAGDLVGSDKTQAKGKLNEAAGSVQNAYGQVKDQASDMVDQARGQAEDIYEQIGSFVQDQPMAAVAIGVGVGVVLGMMLRGGRKTVYVRK